MASRLYRTPRHLYLQVERCRCHGRLQALGSPTRVAVIALTVTGLIWVDTRPTQPRVARLLPGRGHAALNRLLRVLPWSTRARSPVLIGVANRVGREGSRVLDEVSGEQALATRLPGASSMSAFAKQRTVGGFQIGVLLGCSGAGRWRIPVGLRRWRPKRAWRAARQRPKLQVALAVVTAVVLAHLPAPQLVGATHDTAGWLSKRRARLGLTWHGTLEPNPLGGWRGQRQAGGALAPRLPRKWRRHLGRRAVALPVYAPQYGHVRVVVTSNRHGNDEQLVSNDRRLDRTTMVQRQRRRWSVATVFRDSQQCPGLEAGQWWGDQALVRQVGFVLLTCVVVQLLRTTPGESVGAVKERWQLAVIRDGEMPPEPLRACPPHLRPTA